MTEAPQILLQHHLKKLRLPTFQGEYAKQAEICAAENKDHIQYLARLCEMELIERERRMIERRIKAAKFPSTKSLDSFDFKIMPSLKKPLTMELARCDYVDRRENIIALGPSGTGKTHIALGLGLAACQRGLKVRFTTAAALVHDLIEAQDERRLQRMQKQLTSQNLLIIDELGFVPLSPWGLRAMASREGYPPGLRRLLSEGRLRDWLRLLGYDVLDVRRYLYELPCGEPREPSLRVRRGWFYPLPAGGFLLKARKRLHALTPLRPMLRERRRAVLGGLVEPSSANRSGTNAP